MKMTLLLAFVFLFYSTNLFSSENDFDLICNTFKNNPYDSGTSKAKHLSRINETIWNNIKTKQAKDIVSIVASASPDKKYRLFKQMIEMKTGKQWDCPAMKDY